ncbi:TPA: LysM peptidoglycan-binding domain-containing protein, partial [Legionella pneumophila]|nr:LysM peptidoglycan-binding domain-containing protein [Legionella pneumophila]
YNRWTTAPYKPFKLLIPAEKVERFNLNLSNIPEDKRVNWTKHQVKRGDSLDAIAKRYHTTVNLIKQLNQLTSNKVQLNQSLLIPSSKNSPVAAKIPPQEKKPATKQLAPMKNVRIIHIVQNNDSYQKIQKTYGVAAKEIQNWNKLANNAPLRKGQRLIIWKRVKQPVVYIVKSGDSLSVIAKKHQTKVNTIISLNPGLKKSMLLRLGQKILIG